MSAARSDGEQAPTTPRANQDSAPPRASPGDAGAAPDSIEDGEIDPPLPEEDAPPLPDEAPPTEADDGWDAHWEPAAQTWYFINRITGVSQWENPRVPQATTDSHAPYDRNPTSAAQTTGSSAPGTSSPPKRKWGGYNPAIHGSYDPEADYARRAEEEEEQEEAATANAASLASTNSQGYLAQAQFNRFTGKFQQAGAGPEMHNDENKSRRQMSAFFDVDAAANSHDGRSLKAERRGKSLSKKELKEYKEKRRNKKEEKRRAWLRD